MMSKKKETMGNALEGRHALSNEIPVGYKWTEAGVIPEDWNIMQLADICIRQGIVRGPFGGSLKKETFATSGFKVYEQRNAIYKNCEIGSYFIDQSKYAEMHRFSVSPDDFIISCSGTIGRIFQIPPEAPKGIINQALLKLSTDQEVVYDLYFYTLFEWDNFQMRIIDITQGGAMKNLVGMDVFRTTPVVLPSLPEQSAIAEALSDVDGLLAALEALIAKKRAIKQAAMQQLLTGKTRLPGFSGKWETKRLGDTFTYLPTGNNPRADLSEYGQVEYIHYGDVHAHTQPFLNCAYYDLPRIDKSRVANAAHLQDGDLVMVDASEDLVGIGKSIEVNGIAEKNVVAGLHTILCRGNPDCWAMGFKAYLQFIPAFKSALISGATGISVYAISKKQLADIKLALPSPLEQEAIVSILSDMDAEVAALERRRDKTRTIKRGMMQQLLTGRVRLIRPETRSVGRTHNWQFNEAVVISVLVKHFGNEQYPLGRMRYTKLSYLLHRYEEGHAEGYLKKAAGPYNPQTRYGGPEKIALQKDYVRQHRSGKGQGFVASTNVDEAEVYFDRWYGSELLQWLEQFRYKKNNDLELLTTVDMAVAELYEAEEKISVENVKKVIRSHPEWEPKLDRPIFSDASLARAIESCQKLFDY